MEHERFNFTPPQEKPLKPMIPQFLNPPKEISYSQRRFMPRMPRTGKKIK